MPLPEFPKRKSLFELYDKYVNLSSQPPDPSTMTDPSTLTMPELTQRASAGAREAGVSQIPAEKRLLWAKLDNDFAAEKLRRAAEILREKDVKKIESQNVQKIHHIGEEVRLGIIKPEEATLIAKLHNIDYPAENFVKYLPEFRTNRVPPNVPTQWEYLHPEIPQQQKQQTGNRPLSVEDTTKTVITTESGAKDRWGRPVKTTKVVRTILSNLEAKAKQAEIDLKNIQADSPANTGNMTDFQKTEVARKNKEYNDKQKELDNLRTDLSNINRYIAEQDANPDQMIPVPTNIQTKEGQTALNYYLSHRETALQKAQKEKTVKETGLLGQPKPSYDKTVTIQALTDKLKRPPTAEEIINKEIEIKQEGAIGFISDETINSIGQGLVDGTLDIKNLSIRGGTREKVFARAKEIDPSFNAQNYDIRRQLRLDYTSGKTQKNIIAFNTAIGHLGTLKDAAEALKSGNLQALNQIAVFLGTQTGNSAPDVFNAVKEAVSGELATVFKGSAGTDVAAKNIMQTMYSKQSPEQISNVIKTYIKLLDSRLKAINNRYKTVMKQDFPVMDDTSQTIVDSISGQPEIPPPIEPAQEEIDAELERRGVQ
jgi:hypothetical protein